MLDLILKYEVTDLELNFVRDEILLDLRSSLVRLDELLVVCSHDLKSHDLQRNIFSPNKHLSLHPPPSSVNSAQTPASSSGLRGVV